MSTDIDVQSFPWRDPFTRELQFLIETYFINLYVAMK